VTMAPLRDVHYDKPLFDMDYDDNSSSACSSETGCESLRCSERDEGDELAACFSLFSDLSGKRRGFKNDCSSVRNWHSTLLSQVVSTSEFDPKPVTAIKQSIKNAKASTLATIFASSGERLSRSFRGRKTRSNSLDFGTSHAEKSSMESNEESFVLYGRKSDPFANYDECRVDRFQWVKRRFGDNSLGINSSKTAERLEHTSKTGYYRRRWLIPEDHAFKIVWDILTLIVSIAQAHATHAAIRDRQFNTSPFIAFFKVWYVIDIILNFFTERKTTGPNGSVILREPTKVWAKYLTSWFVIDILSLFPAEKLYLKPIVEMQRSRGFFKRNLFRTKAVVKVTKILKGWHFRMFGKVAKRTTGVLGIPKLLKRIIKYVPKYVMYLRNMKVIIALRVLRQFRMTSTVWNILYKNYNRRSTSNYEETRCGHFIREVSIYENRYDYIDEDDPF